MYQWVHLIVLKLNLLKPIGLNIGLYRDDGLNLSDRNGPGSEKAKKQITRI